MPSNTVCKQTVPHPRKHKDRDQVVQLSTCPPKPWLPSSQTWRGRVVNPQYSVFKEQLILPAEAPGRRRIVNSCCTAKRCFAEQYRQSEGAHSAPVVTAALPPRRAQRPSSVHPNARHLPAGAERINLRSPAGL